MKSSILFIVSLISFTLAATPEQTERLEKLSKPCREETGATLEEVTKARQGTFTDNANFRKQTLCVAKKVGFVNESNEIVTDVLRSRIKDAGISDDEADKIVKKCHQEKDTLEETIFETFKCVYQNVPGFSPVE